MIRRLDETFGTASNAQQTLMNRQMILPIEMPSPSGEELKAARLKTGLNQVDAAALMGYRSGPEFVWLPGDQISGPTGAWFHRSHQWSALLKFLPPCAGSLENESTAI